jgi:uncharacterized protein with von Willebrand factor type A (vWA) domain
MSGQHLPSHIVQFTRLLRQLGLSVGPEHSLRAIEAITTIRQPGEESFYWALVTSLVHRREHQLLFDQAFELYFKRPLSLDIGGPKPAGTLTESDDLQRPAARRRVLEAISQTTAEYQPPGTNTTTGAGSSAIEALKQKDFEDMSAAELDAAKRALRQLPLMDQGYRSRRYRDSSKRGRIDWRAMLRHSLASGEVPTQLHYRSAKYELSNLVVLADVSGSMGRYTRALLHLVHQLTAQRPRVFSFVFGTRLTAITRSLQRRDVDQALAEVAARVPDFDGGTRIGASLHHFNRYWARRVMGHRATVLLLTDGLERHNGQPQHDVGFEAQRLRLAAKRVIWLNPLLRFDGFAAKAEGMRALLPHVTELRPAHNVSSLENLVAALAN